MLWRPKVVPFHLNGLLREGVDKVMNIIEMPFIVDAKTMSNQKKTNKIYPIILVNRLNLCPDKDDIMLTQIHAH